MIACTLMIYLDQTSMASKNRDEFNRDSKKLSDVTKGNSQQEVGNIWSNK